MQRKVLGSKTVKFLYNLIITYGLLFCFLVGLICIYSTSSGFEWIFILPVFFGVYFFIFPGVIKYADVSPGILLICLVSFLRYVISPLLTSISRVFWISSGRIVLESIYYNKATILTFYEMTCIMFAIFLFKTRRKSKSLNGSSDYKCILNNRVSIYILLAILAGIILIKDPSLRNNYNFFILDSNATITKYGDFGSGLQSILLEIVRYTFPLIFLPRFYKKYLHTKKMKYVVYSVIPVLFTMSFFIRTSRGSVLVPGVTYLFILSNLYKEKRKYILIGLSMFIFVVMASITLFKSFGLSSTESQISVITIEWLENFFQVYFAGVKNVAVAIKTNEVFNNDITLRTFLTELFRNFPGISHFVSGTDTTTKFFNLIYYDGSLIFDNAIPTIGQGIMYLGYILSPSFSIIFVLISLKCDELYKKANQVENAFIYALIAVNFANNHIANIQLLSAFVTTWVIPLLVVSKLNRILSGTIITERSVTFAKSINNSTNL